MKDGLIKEEENSEDGSMASRKRKTSMEEQEDETTTPKHSRLSLGAQSSVLTTTPAHAALLHSLTSSPVTPSTPSKPQQGSTRKQRIPNDPLNISVYELRKESRDWDDIAKRTNSDCGLAGDKELTGAACYSRFFRNGPLVAKQRGEEYKKEWYVHMKGPVNADALQVSGEEDGTTSEVRNAELFDAVEKVRREFWSNVAAVMNEGRSSKKKLTEEEVKAAYDPIKGT